MLKKGDISWNKGKTGIYSEEVLKKLSESHKGKKVSDDTKEKISKNNSRYWQGKERSEETKRKISASKKGSIPWIKGKKHSEATRKKLSESHKGQIAWNKGIPCSEEVKKQLSEINKKYRPTENAKKRISEKMKIIHASPEMKKKMAEIAKKSNGFLAHKHTEEWKQNHSKKMKGFRHTNEAKEKIRKANKKRLIGEKNPTWKGGRKLASARNKSKRRQLECIPLNDCENGWVGHHMDKKHVLYIPEELHKSQWHTQRNQDSMDKINKLVIDWYICYYELV